MTKWDKRFIQMAKEVAEWSKDPSIKVGAIAVKDRRIIATGYNGFPMGVPDTGLDNRELKYKYTVHAEKNMIYNACRHGVSLIDADVYVWGLPVCGECWKGLVQVGIKKVVMPDINNIEERWKDSCCFSHKNMKQVGVEVRMYKPCEL